MLAGIDLANRARGSGHIKYEWRGLARNADGDRICANERFRAAMRMHEGFTFRHRQADEALTRSLLAVVPNHPYVTAVPNRHRDDSPLFQRGFCSLVRGFRNEWTQAILSVDAQNRIVAVA